MKPHTFDYIRVLPEDATRRTWMVYLGSVSCRRCNSEEHALKIAKQIKDELGFSFEKLQWADQIFYQLENCMGHHADEICDRLLILRREYVEMRAKEEKYKNSQATYKV